ncbi:MAG: WecB/TagA/CpsF family glycosyltransferase [Bdellovibrionales bacterium]|nr:WecB/TagA/CpsF family glycosyltransferase [Bdellovibrionales bacterium]
MTEPSPAKVTILGVPIDNVSLDETVDRIQALAEAQSFSFTVTPNVDHVMKLQNDSRFRQCYSQADLVVCDGVPLLWAAKFLGSPLKGRVNGTDLFERLAARAAETGSSIFLLGGDPGVAEKAADELCRQHPTLRVTGCYCPPYGFENDPAENAKILELIRSAKPTYLFVGLGCPKQEFWIADHGASSGARHAIGIGFSFSFVAGAVRRAPGWMQRYGLEWFWRLCAEPKRLARRYLLEDPKFFWLLFKQKIASQ